MTPAPIHQPRPARRFLLGIAAAFVLAASLPAAAETTYFDGRLLTDKDLIRDQKSGASPASEAKRRPTQGPKRVLMVIANRDFWYTEYAAPRAALEAAGLVVEVAAGDTAVAVPHEGSGYETGDGSVKPDLTIADALQKFRKDSNEYQAVVFVGGWGASSYQYAFNGTYANALYNGSFQTRQAVNDTIGLFLAKKKHVAALCHGVTVLAWARVNGVSPLDGRTVVAWPWQAPPEIDRDGSVFQRTTREHVEMNGATMLPTHSVGDPTSSHDDVVVDGRIITGESYDAAPEFGRVLARVLLGAR